jgi:hypothetical protein
MAASDPTAQASSALAVAPPALPPFFCRYDGAELTVLVTDWHLHKGVASLVAHDKSYVQVRLTVAQGRHLAFRTVNAYHRRLDPFACENKRAWLKVAGRRISQRTVFRNRPQWCTRDATRL